jgi:O-antigen/teichoic acid export membrane protein
MKIRSELAGVSFPAFSAIKEDMERLSSAYRAVTRNGAIFMLSFGAILIPFARPTVLYLLGEKWLPAVSAFRVFMVVAMVRTIFANWGEVYKSLGKTRPLLWTYLPNPILLLALGPYVTSRFGILGMSLLIMGIVLAMQSVVIYLTKKVLRDVSFMRLLWKPVMVFAVILVLSSWVVRLVETMSAFIVGAVTLFALYYVLIALIDRQFRWTAADYVKVSFKRGESGQTEGQ